MILISVGAAPGALAIPAVVRKLAEAGQQVEVILGPRARHFVGPAAFGDAALVDEPSETPEATLYAPATSETVARLARGLDRGAGALGVIAPDLDAGTAEHPAVRENLDLLRADGHRIVEGSGAGMADPGSIVAGLLGGLDGPMQGMRLLVTAGGTREPIDSVRFVGNRSSGKMGLAVAREAVRRGADVTVVSANVEMVEPGTETRAVESAGELRDAVVELAARADALVMAAAVSDFTPASPVREKIRRGSETMSLELVPTDDILASVSGRYPGLFVVGFAATHGDALEDARDKLGRKGADLVVGNDISGEGVGFGADENEVYVVGREEEHFVPRASKSAVAGIILDTMMNEMERQR
ncbi:MAG TPA: bifunctional phosphopantothenoylcysteine decarboxylase/phosphopantothenate--cysteine ligase CoaBC [Rubrobacter sp.]|nr:bifunctional phosphopantothenoylcysteine decarboxylase/phosphopantothenate--cysteine ligase CoaBC [Rubrobacter sp.]